MKIKAQGGLFIRPTDAPVHTQGTPGRLPQKVCLAAEVDTQAPTPIRGRKAQCSCESNRGLFTAAFSSTGVLFITQKVRFTWVNLQLEDVMLRASLDFDLQQISYWHEFLYTRL